jgi:uncharacterized protein (DUF983 family)
MKGTKLNSILKGKCPRCQEGDFFEGSFFKGTPKKECSVCGLKNEREPGFFQGSYYVTYALGVATIISVSVAIMVLFPNAEFDTYLWSVVIAIVVFTPFSYPLSKIIWSNFFVSYDPKIKVEDEKKG